MFSNSSVLSVPVGKTVSFGVVINPFLFLFGLVFAPLHIAMSHSHVKLSFDYFKVKLGQSPVDECEGPKASIFLFFLRFHTYQV